MTIKPVCDRCDKELTEFGGLIFSPPDSLGNTRKLHLCKICYEEIIKEFKRK
jgi:hypothetical protein